MNDIDISRADLNLLKIFEALYDEGSASRAATRLGVTQSAVSAALGGGTIGAVVSWIR